MTNNMESYCQIKDDYEKFLYNNNYGLYAISILLSGFWRKQQ